MTQKEQVKLGAKLLKLSIAQAEEYSGIIPESNDLYLSVPQKGGGAIIIAEDGSVLYAGSAIGFDEHLKAFQDGERTPLDFFDE